MIKNNGSIQMFCLQKNNRNKFNPSECFKYRVEERVECSVSKKVKYTERTDFLLPLPVPMEAATNMGTKHHIDDFFVPCSVFFSFNISFN